MVDLAVITAALFLSEGFDNPYYGFYSPALLGLALDTDLRHEKWLVVRVLTNREIGESLVISENTAPNHVSRILEKLGPSRRSQATTFAAQHGLLAEEPPGQDSPD